MPRAPRGSLTFIGAKELGEVDQLIGIEYPVEEGHEGQREEEAVDAVEDTTQ